MPIKRCTRLFVCMNKRAYMKNVAWCGKNSAWVFQRFGYFVAGVIKPSSPCNNELPSFSIGFFPAFPFSGPNILCVRKVHLYLYEQGEEGIIFQPSINLKLQQRRQRQQIPLRLLIINIIYCNRKTILSPPTLSSL